MNFKVFHCNGDPHQKNIFLHRSVVVPCSPTEIQNNSALTPKSDDYFPDLQVEGVATRKTTPLDIKGLWNPPILPYRRGEESDASF